MYFVTIERFQSYVTAQANCLGTRTSAGKGISMTQGSSL